MFPLLYFYYYLKYLFLYYFLKSLVIIVFTGTVPWKVYYTHFLLAKGYTAEKAEKHVVDYDEINLNQDGL